jgi:hypothetical protein
MDNDYGGSLALAAFNMANEVQNILEKPEA